MRRVLRWFKKEKANGASPSKSQDDMNGSMVLDASTVSLPSVRTEEFDRFFEEPQVANELAIRRQRSLRASTSTEVFPVPPPDAPPLQTTPTRTRRQGHSLSPHLGRHDPAWLDLRATPTTKRRATVNETQRRQIRFTIPEDSARSPRDESGVTRSLGPTPIPQPCWSSDMMVHRVRILLTCPKPDLPDVSYAETESASPDEVTITAEDASSPQPLSVAPPLEATPSPGSASPSAAATEVEIEWTPARIGDRDASSGSLVDTPSPLSEDNQVGAMAAAYQKRASLSITPTIETTVVRVQQVSFDPSLPAPSLRHHSSPSMSSGGSASQPNSRRSSLAERKQSLARRQSHAQVAQMTQSMSGRRAPTTLLPLSQAQIHLVRALWRQIFLSQGPTVIGTSIYHRLCFKNTAVKELVKRAPLPPRFSNHDAFVKTHCKAMAELIDQVVENLDDLDSISPQLVHVGAAHASHMGHGSSKLWNTVAETFIDCTLEWGDKRCRSETVRKAWALIIAFMIEKIKLGHHEQRKMMLSIHRPSVSDIAQTTAGMRI